MTCFQNSLCIFYRYLCSGNRRNSYENENGNDNGNDNNNNDADDVDDDNNDNDDEDDDDNNDDEWNDFQWKLTLTWSSSFPWSKKWLQIVAK